MSRRLCPKFGLVMIITLCGTLVPASGQEKADRRPAPPRGERGERPAREGAQRYSIEQAISDNAQLHTIAFSGLAFLTGDFGAATFLPPGKVCDYFGFQYMRDIDAAATGHNPKFLDRVAGNVLKSLTDEQRSKLESLAREQAPQYQKLAEMRWPLIQAFYWELQGKLPAGSSGLNQAAVARHVGEMFARDAELSYRRAQVVGGIVAAFTPEQQAALARMKFGDFSTWPEVDMSSFKLPRGTAKLVNVAFMTYASELFSWYAGSLEADTYFCPERHGTYFGGFYMKDMPAMGKRDYNISTSLTGDSGEEFLRTLTEEQRSNLTVIPDRQRQALREIVATRRAISAELRKFLAGQQADETEVLKLGRRYGELDGELSCRYAMAFTQVNKSLTTEQRKALTKLRNLEGYTSAPAYIYSDAVREAPQLPEVERFFFAPK